MFSIRRHDLKFSRLKLVSITTSPVLLRLLSTQLGDARLLSTGHAITRPLYAA